MLSRALSPRLIRMLALCLCGALPACNTKTEDPSQARRGKQLRPLGYFLTRELPKTPEGAWKLENPLKEYLVVIVGVPGSWAHYPNLPPEALGDGKVTEGLDLRHTYGSHPKAFSLILPSGQQLRGQYISLFGGRQSQFNNGFSSTTRTGPAADSEAIETIMAIGWEIDVHDHDPPFKVKFSEYMAVPVPVKKYEYPAVMDELFSVLVME